MSASPPPAQRTAVLTAAAVSAVGAPAAALVIHPAAGLALAGAQILAAAGILATALYGSDRLSERAFRLLRLLTGRPEPATRRRSRARTGGTTP